MKFLLSNTLFLGFLTMSTLAIANTPAPQQSAIMLTASEPQFTVQLPGNATTGYQWFLQSYDHTALQLSGYHYNVNNPKLMGSGGTSVFIFNAKPAFFTAPQQTQLQFVYKRAWEDGTPANSKTVTISSFPGDTAQVSNSNSTPSNTDSKEQIQVQSANMMVPVNS